MKKHYICEHRIQGEEPLVFDWDEEAGEVSGPSAEIILAMIRCPYIPKSPPPDCWYLSPEPLKSKADMAAIIGVWHNLPEDLREHYPRPGPVEFGPGIVN